jgi:hypothetical protein
MKTERVLFIRCGPSADDRRRIEDFSVAICRHAEKLAWKAQARWTKKGILVRLRNADAALLHELVTSFTHAAERDGLSLQIAEISRVASKQWRSDNGEIPWGTIIHENLTLRLIRRLPEGALIVSNLLAGGHPILAVRISKNTIALSHIWDRARRSGAAGRMCRVAWSETDA